MQITLEKAIQLLKAGKVDRLVTDDFPVKEYCGIASLTVGGEEYTLILQQDSSCLRRFWQPRLYPEPVKEQPHQGLVYVEK